MYGKTGSRLTRAITIYVAPKKITKKIIPMPFSKQQLSRKVTGCA
jgi:hypothetical protein